MSVKSQEHSMRRLAALLGQDLSYIGGDRESGSNGNKKTFLNVGKVFLLYQYSLANRMVVTDRSASVMIWMRAPQEV